MINIDQQIGAIERRVSQHSSAAGASVVVTVNRRYPAAVAAVWRAITEPDQVSHWMLPLTGDLRAGGTFQLEGNASGDIRTCAAPRHLVITFGGPDSVVDLRLTVDGDQTLLEFDHTVPIEMAGDSAGALYVGPGWDGAVMALGQHLAGEMSADPVEAANSPQGQEFSARSVDAWVAVLEASGTTDAPAIAAARQIALAQFAPDHAKGH